MLQMREPSAAISKPDPHENKDKQGMKGGAALASEAGLEWESVASFFMFIYKVRNGLAQILMVSLIHQPHTKKRICTALRERRAKC